MAALECRIGIMPAQITRPGPVGVVSRSGTLTYEAVDQLSRLGIGQSTCVGIGCDPLIGTSFVDALALFEADPETKSSSPLTQRRKTRAGTLWTAGFTQL